MKVKIRRSCNEDVESIYNLHTKCFMQSDHWYKSAIKNYVNNGIVIENLKTHELIGILLQGLMTPCNKKFDIEDDDNYKEDIFEPVDDIGKAFVEQKTHYKEIYGIVMICIDPNFRGKGLGKKLIEKHFNDNPDKLLCLNTRRSNINAYSLYKKMGYIHIGLIKNKYFLPNEDSIFMIRDIFPSEKIL